MLMFSSNILWNIPQSLVFSRYTPEPSAGCVYLENTSDSWDIPWYTMRKAGLYNYLIPRHRKNSDQQGTMESLGVVQLNCTD